MFVGETEGKGTSAQPSPAKWLLQPQSANCIVTLLRQQTESNDIISDILSPYGLQNAIKTERDDQNACH